ncbi:hypothetical protein BGW36DRAFT_319825, partial [Talaromyces proteolyticus]
MESGDSVNASCIKAKDEMTDRASDQGQLDESEEDLDDDGTQTVSGEVPLQHYTSGERGYSSLKTFNGRPYTGMAVGGSHTWNYENGLWKETKTEPDLWKVDYEATKRRMRRAPKGSGVPVGAQYHWYIIAHQYVEKVDENTYETHLVGSKYKLAHKSATAKAWSIPTVKGQRDRELDILDDAKARLQGLPPVLASEKVKEKKQEKGQQTLDTLFTKRKAAEEDDNVKKKTKVVMNKEQ